MLNRPADRPGLAAVPTSRGPGVPGGASARRLRTIAVLGALCVLGACSPIVRDPTFVGARDQVTEVSLLGPFDGQVVDAGTSAPIEGATVVGVWAYDEGDGLIGPFGSETVEVKTDRAGRYRIRQAPLRIRGPTVRLVSFHLVVYKRGFMGYRSDVTPEGRPRTDFSLRHNRVALEKWRDSDSHAEHLLYLAAPPTIQKLTAWEQEAANVDLYRAMAGLLPAGVGPERRPGDAPKLQLLDASGLLPPEEIRRRTGYTEPFERKELGDLARTHFYHGVHLQAVDREETWDVAYRVWKNPPGGLEPVRETFEATLPGVSPTPDITEETWLLDGEDVRAVAFLDRDRQIAVLLTCGAMQCVDIETAIILAKFLYDHIDALELVDAADVDASSDATTPRATPPTEETPGADDEEDEEDEP